MFSQTSIPKIVAASAQKKDDVSAISAKTASFNLQIDVDKAKWQPHPNASLLWTLNRKPKASSHCWNYFHLVTDFCGNTPLGDKFSNFDPNDKGSPWWASCNICGQLVSAKSFKGSWSNGSLLGHLKSHGVDTPKEKKRLQDGSIKAMFKKQTGRGVPSFKSSQEKSDFQLFQTCKWIAKKDIPLNMVNDKSFRAMISAYDPSAPKITDKVVKTQIKEMDSLIRSTAVAGMKHSHVSLTLDHWTSLSHQNYVAITAHWINSDWELNSIPLGMFLHEGKSTAQAIIDKFYSDVARELNDDSITIFAVTTDTTANMNAFGRLLEADEHYHCFCTDHLLHLTASKAYFGNTPANSCVKIANKVVNHFKQSTQATAQLLNIQANSDKYTRDPLHPILDVSTRWWSTHSMLERLVYLRHALQVWISDHPDTGVVLPSDLQWIQIDGLLELLAPFKAAQKHLEGDKYATAGSVCCAIYSCKKSLQKAMNGTGTAFVTAMATKMLKDYEERWGEQDTPYWKARGAVAMERTVMKRQHGIHRAFIVAAILDPRWKNFLLIEGFGVDDNSKVKMEEEVVSLMVSVLNSVKGKDANVAMMEDDAGINFNDDDSMDSLDALRNARGHDMPTAELQQTSPEQQCKSEWNSYTHLRDVNRKKNPLEWWKNHCDQFPLLAVLAKRFLAVQATSASSERVFSHASRILSHNRTRLHSDVAGQLLYVGMNIEWYEQQLRKGLDNSNA